MKYEVWREKGWEPASITEIEEGEAFHRMNNNGDFIDPTYWICVRGAWFNSEWMMIARFLNTISSWVLYDDSIKYHPPSGRLMRAKGLRY